jgi:hypothetical protein
MMRKPKTAEPSLRAKLSAAFLEALEADFREYGKQVIEKMRETHPERYAELAGKMIMATDQPDPNSWQECNSMQEIGLKLLKSVGLTDEDAATPDMIQAAIDANDEFVAKLSQIAQGN